MAPSWTKVQEFKTLILIFLGNTHHKAKVGRHHPISGPFAHANAMTLPRCAFVLWNIQQLLHGLNVVCQFDLLCSGEERHGRCSLR